MKHQKLKQKPMEEQNLPTEEQESPQPEVPQNSGPEAAKKSGMRWLIAGFVLVLILLGLYFFAVPMFQDAGVDDEDSPPRASMDQGGKFQGAIFDGPMGFLVYEKSDETKFASYKNGLSAAQKAKPTLVDKNVGYYYTDKSIEFNDIIECIDPKAGQVLVMFYSPGEAGDRQENYQKGFYTYPKGPFVNNDSVKFYRAQGYMRIPAGRGFVVISKSKSEAYCFEDATKLGSITPSNPVELGTAGWTMIAAKSTDVDAAISNLEPNVRSVWVQEARGPVQLRRNAGGKYATTLTGSKLLWVKMDGIIKKKIPEVDLSGIKAPELKMAIDGNKITLSWTPLSAEDAKHFAGYMLYYVPLNDKVIAEDSTFDELKSELSGAEEFYFLKNNAKGSEWYPELYKVVEDETAKLQAFGVSDSELKNGINAEYLKVVQEVSLSMDKSSFVINDHSTDLNSALQYVFALKPVPLDIEQSAIDGTFKIFTPAKEKLEPVKNISVNLDQAGGKASILWAPAGKGLSTDGYAVTYAPYVDDSTFNPLGDTHVQLNQKELVAESGAASYTYEFTASEFGKLEPGKYKASVFSVIEGESLSDPATSEVFTITGPEPVLPPTGVSATVTGDGISIVWSAAASGPKPQGYAVIYTPYTEGVEFDPLGEGFVELNSKDMVEVTGEGPYTYEFTVNELGNIKPGTYKASIGVLDPAIEGVIISEPSAAFVVEEMKGAKNVSVEIIADSVTIKWESDSKSPLTEMYLLGYAPSDEGVYDLDEAVALKDKTFFEGTGEGPYSYQFSPEEMAAITEGTYKAIVTLLDKQGNMKPENIAVSEEFTR